MVIKERINKNGKIVYVTRQAEEWEVERFLRQLGARRHAEDEAKAAYQLEHSKGYCPKCHILLPLSGRCDIHG